MKYNSGHSALTAAALNGKDGVIEFLLSKGVDPEIPDSVCDFVVYFVLLLFVCLLS